MVGGAATINIMADYFPIMISTGNKDPKFGLPYDLVFVDRTGHKYYPEVVNSVFNGIEIDTTQK
jgi:hypothetical protein